MRVLILYNPNAGRGRGERVAHSIRDLLASQRADPQLFRLEKESPQAFHERLRTALQGVDLLVIAGGDGTLHHTLPAIIKTQVPIYHLAMGTENLFARQFRMDRTPATLDRTIKSWRTLDIDVATLTIEGQDPHPFVLMCSIGPDAGVIRRLDAVRRGPINHFSYLKPIAAELANPSLPRLTITADGKTIVDNAPGMAIIANSRQYAMRIDPAMNASMTDGLLDIVFFPASDRFKLAGWILKSRFRKHLGKPLTYENARCVQVVSDLSTAAPAYQLDGECGRHVFTKSLSLDFKILPKSLKVLTP